MASTTTPRRAFIVVDIQNDYFPGGLFPVVGIEKAAANAARLLNAARASGELIVHVKHEFPTKEAPFFIPGAPGTEIHETVKNANGELVIVKNHANSFLETDLKAKLDEAGIKDVVIVGAMTHMCIDATTRAAADLGYRPVVIHDATATRDLEFNGVTVPAAQVHTAFLSALAFAYAKVVSTEEHLSSSS